MNTIAAERIFPYLERKERELFIYDCVESTNDIAKKLASQGAADGTAVIADMQTKGRGRLGRSFVSPSGTGIYMSVIMRPELDIELAPMITAAAACAAAEAAERLCGADISIKWVNDLWLNGRKICGILTEASLGREMKMPEYIVIGIGMNVLSVKEQFAPELGSIATSIEDETGVKVSRNRLCAGILNQLDRYIPYVGDRRFLEDYRRRELLTGHDITANIGNEQIIGKAVGIDDSANLIIELPDGELRHLGSGEANLCRII